METESVQFISSAIMPFTTEGTNIKITLSVATFSLNNNERHNDAHSNAVLPSS